MADKYGRVAYECSWCGQNLHELPDDNHSMAPRPVYTDQDGNQYCEAYCRDMATTDDEETVGDSDVDYNNFEEWFAACVIFAAKNNIGPDNYVWSLSNCDEWRDMYDYGLDPSYAVNFQFNSN